MKRGLFQWLLRLHPAPFQHRFGDQMMAAYDEAEGRGMLVDAARSVIRQRLFRRRVPVPLPSPSAGPAFTLLEERPLRWNRLLTGALISALSLYLIVTGFSSQKFNLIVGSFYPRQGVLGIDPASLSPASPTTKVDIADRPVDPLADVGKSYFSAIAVLHALDRDGDFSLSADEINHASEALASLDLNHDGRLTPDECGQTFGSLAAGTPPEELAESVMQFDANHDGKITIDELPERLRPLLSRSDANRDGVLTVEELKAHAARLNQSLDPSFTPEFIRRAGLAFMRFNPVLNALDTDHDGVISRAEMLTAPASLKTLDHNKDGLLDLRELLPDALENEVNLVFRLDTDFDGSIDQNELHGQMFAELLSSADRNHDGVITREELRRELLLRMDLDHNGMVTWEEALRYKAGRH